MEAGREDTAEPNVIALTSESHAQLFYHDGEIMSLFQEPLNNANAHIQHLEQRLRECVQDGDHARRQLYAAEAALHLASSSRTAFERHLQLEQHESGLLREKHDKLTSEMDGILTYNEMLRQEVEHQQQIIESMAGRLATLEAWASDESQRPPTWWDSRVWSSAPQDGSGSSTPRAARDATRDEPEGPRAADTTGCNNPTNLSAGPGPGGDEMSKKAPAKKKAQAKPKAP